MASKASILLDHLLRWRKSPVEPIHKPLDLRGALERARALGADRRVGSFLLPAIGEGRDILLQRQTWPSDEPEPEPARLQ